MDLGVAPFLIDHDPNEIHPDTNNPDTRKNGWLDGGASDNIGPGDGSFDDTDPSNPSAPFMLLTGDPKWADVSIESRIDSYNQNNGSVALVLRAAPKTKFSDPDSHYELQLTTGNEKPLASMDRDGITQPNDTTTDADGTTARGVTLRILKVVKGKWTMLAEQNADKSSVYISRINRLGIDHDVNKAGDDDGNDATKDTLTGGYFRFVAKGDLLQGFVSLDGKKWDKAIEAHDSDLKAGLVGFMHYDYRPLFKEILVQDAP